MVVIREGNRCSARRSNWRWRTRLIGGQRRGRGRFACHVNPGHAVIITGLVLGEIGCILRDPWGKYARRRPQPDVCWRFATVRTCTAFLGRVHA